MSRSNFGGRRAKTIDCPRWRWIWFAAKLQFWSLGVAEFGEAKAATATIPIVFTTGNDPVDAGLVPSLAHPGGNLTGVSSSRPSWRRSGWSWCTSWCPKHRHRGMVRNPVQTTAESRVRKVQEAAPSFGLNVHVLNARTEQEIDAAFVTLAKLRAGAILVDSDPFFNARRDQFVALAAHHAVPVIYDVRETVVAGGLMSYAGSIPEAYRQAGIYTGKILNGAKPADLPILQPTKVELVINLKTAKALGITIPQSLLLRADEVIQ